EFNVGEARQICLGSEVRSRAEHELEIKEKLKAKYAARGKLLEEKDLEILRWPVPRPGTKITFRWHLSEIGLPLRYVSSLRAGFKDFKEKMEVQLEEQAQELYNRVAELEAHMMDVSGRLEGEFYLTYLTLLAGRRKAWRLVMSMGLPGEVFPWLMLTTHYVDAVKALEDASFPLVDLLKSKKDAGIDELSVPINHAGDKTAIGETSLSFALMNVHAHAEGAKKHAAALHQLMMEIVSAPLSSQTWVGEASTSATPLSVEDYTKEDTDEALGSVVAVPKLECCHF
ncbi:hypothetical protein Tco_0724396, partial [Tanacetum coccineum]